MQVEITIGRQTAIADMSGSELEVLARVMAKLTPADSRPLGDEYVYVQSGERFNFEAKIVNTPKVMGQAEFDYARDESNRAKRAEYVKQMQENEDTDGKALIDHLYYSGPLNNDQRKGAVLEGAGDSGVYFKLPGDKVLHVDTFGDVQIKAA